ncbi:hypothetical protein, partial [Frankia sp. Cr1]|uniref:hypothetical protein n=1 Tax=Frankia sp. Cr1 TaxID=3073931 RepID=UPI002AD5242F
MAEIPQQVLDARATVARLQVERDLLVAEAAREGAVNHDRLLDVDRRIGVALDGVLDLFDPCDASPSVPLVLLPVRLETRFKGNQLLVRIFPDSVHVDDLQRGLTPDEIAAGRGYWTSVWSDPVPDTAWPQLVKAVGVARAEWVAHVCTPTNLGDRGAGVPQFADPETAGPRTITVRSLPDRFVVLAVHGEQVSKTVGKVVPRDLSLSPIPQPGDAFAPTPDALNVPPASEWLVDFGKAVEVGMAVRIDLQGGAGPIDRVIAIGTRPSLKPEDAAAELEALFTGHRFSQGLGLLAQGTATNNNDSSRSPFQPRRAPVPPSFVPATTRDGSDTAAAAKALGVDARVLTGLVGDGVGEQAVARAVNTALWTPGWGEYMYGVQKRKVAGLDDAQRESARELFRDHVRGQGNAPALCIGAQPYGLLTVSNVAAWRPKAGESTAGIKNVLDALLPYWQAAARTSVPKLRPGAADVEATLLEIMGSSPVMQGLRVRPVFDDDATDAALKAFGLSRRAYEAEQTMRKWAFWRLGLRGEAAKLAPGSLHQRTRPLPLPLVDESDSAFITTILADSSQVPKVASVLQAMLALALKSDEARLARSAPATVLGHLIDLSDLTVALKTKASTLAAQAGDASPDDVLRLVDEIRATGVTAASTSKLATFEPIPAVRTSLGEVALSAPVTREASTFASEVFTGWLLQLGYLGEVRSAMQALVGTDLATRRNAVASALDCSSHRLDAWISGVVNERRARQAGAFGSRGLTIGAYGVVEDLVPDVRRSGDGWIHAPSTRHAVAAGILRSSHLSHLSQQGNGPFAIDLSSMRIQKAHGLIEGVRSGQQLGSLIGYQIERGLAAKGLARLQLSLRNLAPLVARRLNDADGADDSAAKEAIAADNVVDGVLLLHKFPPDDPAKLATLKPLLDAEPVNAYLEPGQWKPLVADEWNAVQQVLRDAAETIDAVADIMLSESVLHYAGGNPFRAAAAMDAMSTGASPNDTIDVLEAQDSGDRLTHRVLAVVGANPPASGWNTLTPRALTEPRIESWAAAHLGDPAKIVVADTDTDTDTDPITLDQAGLAALDLVFSTDLPALERLLRQRIPALGDAEIAVRRNPAWPADRRALGQTLRLASVLRSMIAGASPVLPADLARPTDPASRDLTAALPELIGRVTALAAGFAAAVQAAEPTLHQLPPDGISASEADAVPFVAAAYTLAPYGVPLAPFAGRPLDVSWT